MENRVMISDVFKVKIDRWVQNFFNYDDDCESEDAVGTGPAIPRISTESQPFQGYLDFHVTKYVDGPRVKNKTYGTHYNAHVWLMSAAVAVRHGVRHQNRASGA
jgi:hypothetical protein